MPRVAQYTQAQYDIVVKMAKEGKTIESIVAETGLTTGQVQGIKGKAGLVTPRGPRKGAGAAPKGKRVREWGSAVDALLLPFMEEPGEQEEENGLLISLREEQTNIEKELLSTKRKLDALVKAKAWWATRIQLVEGGEEDPGSAPPDDWTVEEEGEEAPATPRKSSKKKSAKR